MTPPSARVFCDFDGTVVHEDVGNAFFRQYGGEPAERAVAQYRAGTIDAATCLRLEAEAVGPRTREFLQKFADGFAVDATFPAFVAQCAHRRMPLTILSDGLDVYVRRILENAGLGHLPVFANRALFEEGRLSVEFPYRDETCSTCGNCKRNHVVTLSGDDDVVVYAGDGISDRCAVAYADIVFARGSLVAYCQERNITYHTFRSFGEVRLRLDQLIATGAFRQRREAVMARRALFVAG